MWTPRRISLLALGYLGILAAFLGYSISALGGIDGLPTLPEHLRPPTGPVDELGPPPQRVRRVEERLRQAFGSDSPELKWPIQLELNNRALVVAATNFKLEPDGRISLYRVAVAAFSRDRGATYPEINTLRGDLAYLKFDRPISNLSEVGGRKIIGAEITGNIQITSNRRTADRGDDIAVHIGTGPLYYAEPKQLIWTHDTVHILDYQSTPRPTEIWGKGLEVELVAEAPTGTAKQPARRPGSDRVSGVKRMQLQSNVDMTLYVDGSTGFPGGRRDKPSANPATPPEKAKLTIKTSGKFQYDFLKDHDLIQFDIPAPDASQAARGPQFVMIERFYAILDGRKEVRDQLFCAHLELHLKKRDSQPTGEKKPQAGNDTALLGRGTTLLFARATGPQVTLTSDTESLEATCIDLVHDARLSRTILRGDPKMTATKDRNRIQARELHITEHPSTVPGRKGYQTVLMVGPGRFDLMDEKQADKINAQAFWNDKLTTSREGDYELLVLTGAARFVDRQADQSLQGETLKVWSTSSDALLDKKVTLASNAPGAGRKIQVIEALGNVSTTSRELNIHDSSRLIVRFRDVSAEGELPQVKTGTPGTPPLGNPVLPGRPAPEPLRPVPPPMMKPVPGPAQAQVAIPNAPQPNANTPARPIALSARNVEVWISRAGPKSALERVWTEGSVHVKQAPAKPEEKGLDIRGDTLAMDCHATGNVLEVTGDLAELRMDRLHILGPVVNIDQTRNLAWVHGSGAMQMESQTNFAGDKLERAVPMVILWRKSMVFHGKYAEFYESIQAQQESALMVCDMLQVFFDRHIELKQGSRADQPPRVQSLVCDKNVRIEENVLQNERVLKYQRIETNESLRLDALEPENDDPKAPKKQAEGNEIRSSGPGSLRLYQAGGPDPLAIQAKPGQPKKDGEPKLTYIQYNKSLYANSKLNKAIFQGQVRVINMPATNPLAEIKLENLIADLPKDAFYLSCDRMTVLNRGDKARSQQEMLAQGRVAIKAREFWGQAETITYNEAKDQIILDGGPDGEATLYKEGQRGGAPQQIKGKKITYIRSTGDFKLDEGRGVLGQ